MESVDYLLDSSLQECHLKLSDFKQKLLDGVEQIQMNLDSRHLPDQNTSAESKATSELLLKTDKFNQDLSFDQMSQINKFLVGLSEVGSEKFEFKSTKLWDEIFKQTFGCGKPQDISLIDSGITTPQKQFSPENLSSMEPSLNLDTHSIESSPKTPILSNALQQESPLDHSANPDNHSIKYNRLASNKKLASTPQKVSADGLAGDLSSDFEIATPKLENI